MQCTKKYHYAAMQFCKSKHKDNPKGQICSGSIMSTSVVCHTTLLCEALNIQVLSVLHCFYSNYIRFMCFCIIMNITLLHLHINDLCWLLPLPGWTVLKCTAKKWFGCSAFPFINTLFFPLLLKCYAMCFRKNIYVYYVLSPQLLFH